MRHGLYFLFILCVLTGCDSIEPTAENLLVVEGFLDAGKPLPNVSITRVQPLTAASAGTSINEAVSDASLSLIINNTPVPYRPSASSPGTYEPATSVFEVVPPHARFSAEVNWQSQRATTTDIVPPPIAIEDVFIRIPESPVSAVLLDSLRLEDQEVGARMGFIYPIDVSVSWQNEMPATDTTYWIEARLKPQSDFSSTVLDVFLLTEDVQVEDSLRTTGSTRFSWSGVYAIPVPDSLAPAPAHLLTVQLTRGTKAYADFAASRNAPERREPVSNIAGGIGILAGISLDAIVFEVKDGVATAQ
ncbi:MAG: DUF4249 family protein [Bacteroidota bacterium]